MEKNHTYHALVLPVTDPDSGKTFELKLFGLSETDVAEWERIFKKGVEFSDIFKKSFKLSKPVDLVELAGFDGFKDFIAALEGEEPE